MLASHRWLRRCALACTSFVSMTTLLLVPGATVGSADAAERVRERKIDRALTVARRQIGDPYSYGAAGPGAFDCSGLTMFAYGKAGINLPRSSAAQASAVRRIPRQHMHKGDLMFFYDGGGVYHLGIFTGWDNGRRVILHSSTPGRPVQTDRVWTSSWYAGTLRHRR
ncbi:MAG: C40 family peptidase [Nocardioidaceae bacterium]|nr:C40 family peptidase [Nocardioidaceae bacterium]